MDADRRGRRGVVALTYLKNLIRTHLRQSSGSACATGWSVGAVIARRGVVTGLGSDDGSGRYHVQFDGVPKSVHVQLMRNFCQCNAHIKMLRHLGRRMKGALDQSVVQLLAKAERDCESAHLQGASEAEIVQLGYARGGFYSYDLLDNAGVPSADHIVDEYHDLDVGDLVPMHHETPGLAIAYMVDSFHRNEWMLWVHRPNENERPDSTWSWRLTELPGNETRLVTRLKQDYRWETQRLAAFNACPDGVRRLRHGTPHAQRHQGPGRAREQLSAGSLPRRQR